MPKITLTSQERSALKAAAHPLRPVVMIGDRGLSEAVLKEIDLNLNAHELIKVRVAGQDRAERDAMLDNICNALNCAAVHHLGRILILYRPIPEEPEDFSTRAIRKPSEPYIPKKLAAEGISKVPKNYGQRSNTQNTGKKRNDPADNQFTARHNVPRRSHGSALTLRAGIRQSTRSTKRS